MAQNPNNASYKSSDPTQMKPEPGKSKKPKKGIKISAKAPLIQQMPWKG